MIERFIKLLDINYKIRKLPIRFAFYFTAIIINYIYISAGVIQIYLRMFELNCTMQIINYFNWQGNLIFSNILGFLMLLTIKKLNKVETQDENSLQSSERDHATTSFGLSDSLVMRDESLNIRPLLKDQSIDVDDSTG